MGSPPPDYLDDDPVAYHRLTAHGHWSMEQLIQMSQQGFALLSLDERLERDEEAPATGLDPVDLAAGDGAGIFLSLGEPARSSMWSGWRSKALKSPGVGFRMSTLLRLGETTLRPVDLQGFYMQAVEPFLGKRMGELLDEYDDPSALLDEFEPALALIRKLGEVPATLASATLLLERDEVRSREATTRDVEGAFRAIENAVYDYTGGDDGDWDEDDEPEDDEKPDMQDWYTGLRAQIDDAWQHPTSPEVVFWGGALPLDHADVFFDASGGWVYRDDRMRRNPSAVRWVAGR